MKILIIESLLEVVSFVGFMFLLFGIPLILSELINRGK